MLTLVVIGLLSGIVTGLSPCILPVLPAVLATSAISPGQDSGPPPDRRRPFIVIAGLVTSFAVTTLAGAAVLTALGLPEDLLRVVGIAAMAVVGIGLLIPAVGHLLERPFARFSRVGPRRGASAFWFGATFGIAFVPCAGPVLAAITVVAATSQVGSGAIVLTLAFSVGVAIPLLGFAFAGQQMAERIKAVRSRMSLLRKITGAVLVVTAVAVWFGLSDQVQRLVPSYVSAAQSRIEDNDTARAALDSLVTDGSNDGQPVATRTTADAGRESFAQCSQHPDQLADCGPAPELTGIQAWLNTPDGKALSLAKLRGHVVLIDFWTYSCINCQRTLPYLTAWDDRYRDKGLTIIGVHSPEFAFEHVVDNVADQANALGVHYPVAIDNDFQTWRAYDQRFWPAHYLIDRDGTVRQVHYGEGAYTQTEQLIRQLLDAPETGDADVSTTIAADDMMSSRTAETYLGAARGTAYVNAVPVVGVTQTFTGTDELPSGGVALDGEWTFDDERATAVRDASIDLAYRANDIYAVLEGSGTVRVLVDGTPTGTVRVEGTPTLYPVPVGDATDGVLRLQMPVGMSIYTFTFG